MHNEHRLVICNEGCGKKFAPKPKVAMLSNAIQKVYFICPHCKKQYVAFYTDLSIRKLQRQQRDLRPQEGEEAFKQFTLNQNEIKRQMEALKQKMEG